MSFDFSGWTLVFDLDGTLVETAPDLHAALNHTLAHKGLAPVTLDTIRMMIGDGAKAMIRKGLDFHQAPIDQAEIDKTLWPIFLDFYSAHITRLSTPFEDSMSCLSALQQDGATLAVCTNKAQGLAEQVLSGLQMDRQFKAIVGCLSCSYHLDMAPSPANPTNVSGQLITGVICSKPSHNLLPVDLSLDDTRYGPRSH